MNRILFIFLVCAFNGMLGQEMSLKKGAVVNDLKINDSIQESFSLYLPTNFDKDKMWPVIFVFDPMGRGRNTAHLFLPGAEQQGYIVASSNNISFKDSLSANVDVALRLMNKTFNYFPIDNNRVYTAGYKEGAVVASAIPAIYPNIQGVLAVDDFWSTQNYLGKDSNFSVVALIGEKDANIYKLQQVQYFLNKSGHTASLYSYNSNNEWPGAEMISQALAEFSLQSMSKGLKHINNELINDLYNQDVEISERLRRSLQPYKAYQYLEKMEMKYALFDKKDDIRNLQKEIKKEHLFKEQRREYNRAKIKESQLKEEYIYYFEEDVYTVNFENIAWWKNQVKELEEMQKSKVEAQSEMAYRIQGFLQVMSSENFSKIKQERAGIDRKIYSAVLQTVFKKDDPEAYLYIISQSANDGDYYTALLYLEDLLKTGYKDLEELYNIPNTLDLKLSPEYNTLIKKYTGTSKYYNIGVEE
ncbi:hypothetical protein L1I30_10345 [Gillisia sp. M10.2A]|uniref:Alpha/beta hydrolase n=1 Tax=Gillisia lutea TaxID=2909668 RepID=A0ABS9EI85_9FLAO|nr:hypothetical protein [Gillisia lutea]MCF4102067.1 hypothetical protein [Gillisia lutea]